MPLYECECQRCDLIFEVLASLSESGLKSFPCPECGKKARRIPSAAVLGRAGNAGADSVSDSTPANPSRSDVTKLRVPPPAQICWMDGPSNARYAAYLNGRGAEYDDTMAARAELKKKRGEPEKPVTKKKPHGHDHDHSPLSDPGVYARRRAAAAKKEKPAAPNRRVHPKPHLN